MAELAALRELYAWMREENILYARAGELELRLEPRPAPPPTAAPELTAPTEAEDERRSLEELFYSSGADPTPFILAMQKREAA